MTPTESLHHDTYLYRILSCTAVTPWLLIVKYCVRTGELLNNSNYVHKTDEHSTARLYPAGPLLPTLLARLVRSAAQLALPSLLAVCGPGSRSRRLGSARLGSAARRGCALRCSRSGGCARVPPGAHHRRPQRPGDTHKARGDPAGEGDTDDRGLRKFTTAFSLTFTTAFCPWNFHLKCIALSANGHYRILSVANARTASSESCFMHTYTHPNLGAALLAQPYAPLLRRFMTCTLTHTTNSYFRCRLYFGLFPKMPSAFCNRERSRGSSSESIIPPALVAGAALFLAWDRLAESAFCPATTRAVLAARFGATPALLFPCRPATRPGERVLAGE